MTVRIERLGRFIDADEVFHAWMSADLRRMLAARSIKTNPIDRHFLLQSIVQQCYKARTRPDMRELCIQTGLKHLEEWGAIGLALRKDFGGKLPRVPSFAWLATALGEAERFDEASKVCEEAARYGLDDGTKGGYAARAAKWREKGKK